MVNIRVPLALSISSHIATTSNIGRNVLATVTTKIYQIAQYAIAVAWMVFQRVLINFQYGVFFSQRVVVSLVNGFSSVFSLFTPEVLMFSGILLGYALFFGALIYFTSTYPSKSSYRNTYSSTNRARNVSPTNSRATGVPARALRATGAPAAVIPVPLSAFPAHHDGIQAQVVAFASSVEVLGLEPGIELPMQTFLNDRMVSTEEQLSRRYYFTTVFSQDKNNYNLVRAAFKDRVYKSSLRPSQSFDWYSQEEINAEMTRRGFTNNQILNEGAYFHATRTLSNLEGIFQRGQVVASRSGYAGAFTARLPAEPYGDYVLVFRRNIEFLSKPITVITGTGRNGDWWIGQRNGITITERTLACILVKSPRYVRDVSEEERADVERLCRGWTGRSIPVIAAAGEVKDQIQALFELNKYIPNEWSRRTQY